MSQIKPSVIWVDECTLWGSQDTNQAVIKEFLDTGSGRFW